MRILLIFLVLLVFIKCKNPAGITNKRDFTNDTSIVISKNNGKCKIFYSEYNADYFEYRDYLRWNPVRQDVWIADSILVGFIASSGIPTLKIKNNLAEYYRQYFGLIDKVGAKIIFVNCFFVKSPSIEDKWTKMLITADDGGDLFFNATINLEKRAVVDMKINNH
mgnify:CR=1 FL=1